jgi:Zn-finger nucleic acid-binding protein
MKKRRVLDQFLIDQCSECEGIWFDKGELRMVREAARDSGREEALGNTWLWSAMF